MCLQWPKHTQESIAYRRASSTRMGGSEEEREKTHCHEKPGLLASLHTPGSITWLLDPISDLGNENTEIYLRRSRLKEPKAAPGAADSWPRRLSSSANLHGTQNINLVLWDLKRRLGDLKHLMLLQRTWVPSTTRWLTTICNFSSRGSEALFRIPWEPGMHMMNRYIQAKHSSR